MLLIVIECKYYQCYQHIWISKISTDEGLWIRACLGDWDHVSDFISGLLWFTTYLTPESIGFNTRLYTNSLLIFSLVSTLVRSLSLRLALSNFVPWLKWLITPEFFIVYTLNRFECSQLNMDHWYSELNLYSRLPFREPIH